VLTGGGTEPTSLLDALLDVARHEPERVAYRFLADGDGETDRLAYGELLARATTIAGALSSRCARGDRVALLFAPDLAFVPALIGTWLAGCVAIPVAPPTLAGQRDRIEAILADADPTVLLTDRTDEEVRLADIEVLRAAEIAPVAAGGRSAPPRAEELALLQYTSGSTGSPKGVMVTHGNLLANQRQIAQVFGQDERAVVVSWLPLYHDMGLIGGVLHPLYLGASCVMMPPAAFMRRPLRWLQAIDAHRGTISPAPDFAYELCAARATADDVAALDLRSWEVACDGSEPVRPDTIRRFTSRFAAAGFDPRAFAPAYGLAEATLLVSGVQPGREPRLREVDSVEGRAQEIVGCGPPTTDVAIVRRGRPLADGEEGEIWLCGPSVAAGYWGDARETRRTFGARLRGHDGSWLRTGDLGLLLDGELFVTGRVKDLVIVRGRNHHPHDLEATARTVDPRLAAAVGAAFSDGERLVLVHGVRGIGELDELPERIRQAIAREHGVRVDEVVLVRPRGVPRTTSGKVRRAECRRRLRAGELPVVLVDGAASVVADGGAIEGDALARVVAEVLEVPLEAVGEDAVVSRLGVDSLRAMQLQQEIAERFDVDVPIEALLGEATVGDLARTATRRDPRATSHPLPPSGMTRGQEALWALAQAGHEATYTIARAVELPAEVDVPALERAVDALVARHAQLRSRFALRDGTVRRGECTFDEHVWCDVRRLPATADLDAEVRALAREPLDLAAGGLFRVTLFVRERRTVLLLRVSHLVVDLHALATLVRELVLRYEADVDGRPLDLPDAPSFPELVRREAAYLAGGAGAAALEQAARALVGVAPAAWPVVRPRAADPATAATTIVLDEEATRRVEQLARVEGTTVATVLLTLYGLFLTRLLGDREVVVGLPTAVRPDAAARDVVGYLVNTVPVRLDLRNAPDLSAAVRLAKAATLRAMGAQRVPLSEIVRRRRELEGADAGSLPHALFDLLDDPRPGTSGLGALALGLDGTALEVGSLRAERFSLDAAPAAADLDVAFAHVEGSLVGRFAWDPEVFDADTGALLAQALRGLVHDALRDQAAAPASRSLGGEAASRLGRPRMGAIAPEHLDELFDRQVRERPDAVALVHGAHRWSYRELAAWVAAAADALPAPASGGGTPLAGVLGDRDAGFVAALLAVWRRGYGIVPLSPDLPDERLRLLLDESGAQALLALPRHGARARALARGAFPAVELAAARDEPPAAAPLATGAPTLEDPAQRVAYVVFTSGTTGRPKGVPITHANVHPLLAWQVEGLGAGPGMRLAQTLSFAFDFGLQEILTTVLFGGTLCLPRDEERHSAEGLAAFLARERVTALFTTPTFVRELTATDVHLRGLELLVIGGELLAPAIVERVRTRLAPRCRVVNGYGPTEASINCAMRLLPARVEGTEPLSVGEATGDSRLYVLDRMLRPLPPGLVGEVCIGGAGVAEGYLGRPEETAARFVADPFAEDGARMFRSGDLGRFLPDGGLQILGRLDDQLKVRGHRVEPREVELALRSLPGVVDTVVLARGDGAALHLIAFVRGAGVEPERLRRALTQRLPAYMIPSRIVLVDELPITEVGKLDARRLLLQLEQTPPPAAPERPASAVQRIVATIWRETLGIDSIDEDANFFELGGHSLAVGTIVARACADLGLETVPYHAIFEHPTVRAFSSHLERLLQGGSAVDAPRGALAVKRRRRR